MKKTKISSKGQITLPSIIRRKLRINTGDVLCVTESNDKSVVLVFKDGYKYNKADAVDAVITTSGIWKDDQGISEIELKKMRETDLKRINYNF